MAAPAEPSPSTARGGGQLAMHSPALRVASMAKRLAALGTPTAPLAIVSKRKALGEAADVEGADEGSSEASSEDTWEWSEKDELIAPIGAIAPRMCAC